METVPAAGQAPEGALCGAREGSHLRQRQGKEGEARRREGVAFPEQLQGANS